MGALRIHTYPHANPLAFRDALAFGHARGIQHPRGSSTAAFALRHSGSTARSIPRSIPRANPFHISILHFRDLRAMNPNTLFRVISICQTRRPITPLKANPFRAPLFSIPLGFRRIQRAKSIRDIAVAGLALTVWAIAGVWSARHAAAGEEAIQRPAAGGKAVRNPTSPPRLL